jgi:hypothetical protein
MLLNAFVSLVVDALAKKTDRKKLRGIRNSYQKLGNKKLLSSKQKKEIEDYFRGLIGHSVPTDWHQYFYSRTGIYSKKYIPSSEYKNHLIGRLNIYPLHLAYNDKNMTDVTLPHTHQPKIYLKNMGGYYYVDGRAVSEEEALSICKNLGEVIIKPSLTGRRKGVRRITVKDGMTDYDNKSLKEVFDEYCADFLVQKVIRQHPEMSALNPSSIYQSGLCLIETGWMFMSFIP